MKLARIHRLREHRVFRDFSWPVELHPFGRFNVIYGWNGSGKTTLSSLLALVERRTPLTEGELELELDDGSKVSGAELATRPLPAIRVFDRDFIQATFHAAGSDIAPIYFLGEDSVEKQAEVEALEGKLGAARAALAEAEEVRARADAALDDLCREKAKLIKEVLTSAHGAGYNHYDKRRFKHAMEALAPGAPRLDDAEKARLRSQKDANPKGLLDKPAAPPLDLPKLRAEVEQLVTQSVVAQTLDELKSDTEVGIWAQRGLALHSGPRHASTCRFCAQPFSEERRAALEAHFNDALTALQRKLDAMASQLVAMRDRLAALRVAEPSRFYDHLLRDATEANEAVRTAILEATAALDAMLTRVRAKRENPFALLPPLEDIATKDIAPLATALRAHGLVVDAHNRTTEDFQRSVKEASEALERGYLHEAHADYRRLSEAATAAAQREEELRAVPLTIRARIDVLLRALVEHRRPAEELTEELRAYLGRDELRFQVEGAGYRLTRQGESVSHLSEGERTAIAFLYFLKSIQDKGFDRTRGVVVIDDPQSSLDANALHAAFAYMKERTKDCGQLILLTHSFPWLRLVKDWFHHLPGQDSEYPAQQPARFFMLRARDTGGLRGSRIEPLDPLLRQHTSEYPFLFKRVYEAAHRADVASLEQSYELPHLTRRLLESFLAFRFPDMPGALGAQLERVPYDHAKKARILRLLDAPTVAIGDPELDLSHLAEAQPVLRDVLAMMRSLDADHYEGLIKAGVLAR